jgi:hypothetical protein
MRSFTPVRARLWLIAVLILAPRPPFLSAPYRHHATQDSYRALPRDLADTAVETPR